MEISRYRHFHRFDRIVVSDSIRFFVSLLLTHIKRRWNPYSYDTTMTQPIKIGIIICDRYRTCAGGKCLRAMHNREGAFERYVGEEIELVGFATCSGCPGGNVESAPAEMKKNGAEIIHLATGMIVGYPPCPRITYFKRFITEKFGLEVVIGTHPVPTSYYTTHTNLGTWSSDSWKELLAPTLTDEKTREAYN